MKLTEIVFDYYVTNILKIAVHNKKPDPHATYSLIILIPEMPVDQMTDIVVQKYREYQQLLAVG